MGRTRRAEAGIELVERRPAERECAGVDELRVLGPVEVVGDDGADRAAAAKQRRLLAALVVADGRACRSMSWSTRCGASRRPASARKLLQVYVSQLRKALPPRASDRDGAGGYALDARRRARSTRCGSSACSRRALRGASRAGTRRSPSRSPSRRSRSGAAGRTATWRTRTSSARRGRAARGAPLARSRSASTRSSRSADTPRSCGEVLALAARAPLRERTAGAGDARALPLRAARSEALEHYAAVRRRLDEELGLEPGPALRELQQRDPPAGSGARRRRARPTTALPAARRRRTRSSAASASSRSSRRSSRAGRCGSLVLTGAGGSGKTRLALEAARRAAPSFANGAVLVELAPLRDPELVVPTIAQALDVAEAPGDGRSRRSRRAGRRGAAARAGQRRAPAARQRPLFAELRRARAAPDDARHEPRGAPRLGRARLPGRPARREADAVELFVQRASSSSPRSRATQANEHDVREICRRVDGLPLAIELAAARIRTLTPRALLERLDERLALPDGRPARPSRAPADAARDARLELRAALARTSARCSRGSPSSRAARRSRRREGLPRGDDERRARPRGAPRSTPRSLLAQDGARRARGTRCSRRSASTPPSVCEESAPTRPRRRHAEWCLALAERAEPGAQRRAAGTVVRDARGRARQPARRARRTSAATGERELALRLAVALSRFWYVRGHLGEARRRLDEALADTRRPDRSAPAPGATAAAARSRCSRATTRAATRFAEEALAAARASGEPRFVANALSNLGAIVLAAGDHERAAVVLEEAVALAREVGDARITALAINNLGDLALTTGDYARARPLFEESHALSARAATRRTSPARSSTAARSTSCSASTTRRTRRFREALALAGRDGRQGGPRLVPRRARGGRRRGGRRRAGGDAPRAARRAAVADGRATSSRSSASSTSRRSAGARMLCGPDAYSSALARGASLTLGDGLALAQERGRGRRETRLRPAAELPAALSTPVTRRSVVIAHDARPDRPSLGLPWQIRTVAAGGAGMTGRSARAYHRALVGRDRRSLPRSGRRQGHGFPRWRRTSRSPRPGRSSSCRMPSSGRRSGRRSRSSRPPRRGRMRSSAQRGAEPEPRRRRGGVRDADSASDLRRGLAVGEGRRDNACGESPQALPRA